MIRLVPTGYLAASFVSAAVMLAGGCSILFDPSTAPAADAAVDASAPLAEVERLFLGSRGRHTCARYVSGEFVCWGPNAFGQLGYGDLSGSLAAIGDDEPASAGGSVAVGGTVVDASTSQSMMCALVGGLGIKCWGEETGPSGPGPSLGYGDGASRSLPAPEPLPAFVDPVSVSCSASHCCALDAVGVSCWGEGTSGKLGRGSEDYGDRPAVIAPLADVTSVGAGFLHSCSLHTDDNVRCWGSNSVGALGHPGENIGDDQSDDLAESLVVFPLNFGQPQQLAVGGASSCVRTSMGEIYCWGSGNDGRLGNGCKASAGTICHIGDGDTTDGNNDEPVAINFGNGPGSSAQQLVLGRKHGCAIMDDASLRCWGDGSTGKLGYGDVENRGDTAVPLDVPVLENVVQVVVGLEHTCALLEDATVRCWGNGQDGRLGNQCKATPADERACDVLNAQQSAPVSLYEIP